MSESITVNVVKVFVTADGTRGNELGIVESSASTAGREQSIARDLGYAETIFIDSIVDEVCAMRIFTPEVEHPFAGHPTVGAAWWLTQADRPVRALHVPAGDVLVRQDGDATWVAAQGTWANEFRWVPLPTPEDVLELDPADFVGGPYYAYGWTDAELGSIRSRMFATAFGIPEDEATGGAAVRLTWELGRDLTIRQGTGSELFTRALTDDMVELGGRVVFDSVVEFDTT